MEGPTAKAQRAWLFLPLKAHCIGSGPQTGSRLRTLAYELPRHCLHSTAAASQLRAPARGSLAPAGKGCVPLHLGCFFRVGMGKTKALGSKRSPKRWAGGQGVG